MNNGSRLKSLIVAVAAAGMGLVIAALDLISPFGDDSAQFTISLWLACCGILGFAAPYRPWRWALLVGPWVAFLYLVLHFVRPIALAKPFSYDDLFLIPIGLVVCLVGAYGGVLLRRLLLPPSSLMQTTT
jgi:peptidoglycan/LPS O-acetylase OafA/YrhL